jgi:hypothetical protein
MRPLRRDLEYSDTTVGGGELHHRDHTHAEPPELRVDRGTPFGRLDRCLEQHVEQRLLPDELSAVGQRRRAQMRERGVEGSRTSVARDRARAATSAERHALAVL